MDYNLLEKQYRLIKEKMSKKEKKFIFEFLINKEDITEEKISLYGEILEEIEEKD